jgi:hypothetical protein
MNIPIRISCALLLLVSAAPCAFARDKVQPIAPDVAAALTGKTLGVTRRAEKPSFIAMTAGKATFAVLGVAAMAADGNKLVKDNQIADPADIIESALVAALVKHYGLVPNPAGVSTITPGNDLKQIIAAQPGADLILDIRTIGWQYAYGSTHWSSYWVSYAVETKLIDASSGKQLTHQSCSSNTQKHAVHPSREQLVENQAQLLKEVLGHLSWNCAQQIGSEEFKLAAEQLPPRPEQFVDPLAVYASQHPVPAEPATAANQAAN